eukprot:Awhi_evm1s10254
MKVYTILFTFLLQFLACEVQAQLNDECYLLADMHFIFDKSGSISYDKNRDPHLETGRRNLFRMKTFTTEVMQRLPVAEDQVHVTFSAFNQDISGVSKFDEQSYDRTRLGRRLDSIKYLDDDKKKSTYLKRALDVVEEDVFDKDRIERKNGEEATKIIIILTDGNPNDRVNGKGSTEPATTKARALRRKGYVVFTVGIGRSIDRDVLKDLAGKSNRVLQVDDFKELGKLVADLSKEICKVNCQVGKWSNWSPCDAQCKSDNKSSPASGSQTRRRSKIKDSENGGAACPALEDSQKCNIPCKVDCRVGSWGGWSSCDAMCQNDNVTPANGKQDDSRKRLQNPLNGGQKCPALERQKKCAIDCPVDCLVSEWSSWGECDAKCRKENDNPIARGSYEQRRRILRDAKNGGKECPPLKKAGKCETDCKVDCTYTNWTPWSQSKCSAVCSSKNDSDIATGTEIATRTVDRESVNGGKTCPDEERSRSCSIPCKVDCIEGPWSKWTKCDGACSADNSQPKSSEGKQYRERRILRDSKNGGKQCKPLEEDKTCNFDCPVDCLLGPFRHGECDAKCGRGIVEGYIHSIRDVIRIPQNGGEKCDDLTNKTKCQIECPIDCEISDFKDLGCPVECPENSDVGTVFSNATFRANITQPPMYGGLPCPDLEYEKPCNVTCEVDCQVSDWFFHQECNATCVGVSEEEIVAANGTIGGFFLEKRNITRRGLNGGDDTCADETRPIPCDTPCDAPCVLSPFTDGECSAVCNGVDPEASGTFISNRTIIRNPINNGLACGDLTMETPCMIDCDVDCEVGDWTDLGECTSECINGTSTVGTQNQTRVITRNPHNDGEMCPPLEQQINCTIPCTDCNYLYEEICDADCGDNTTDVVFGNVSAFYYLAPNTSNPETCLSPPNVSDIARCNDTCVVILPPPSGPPIGPIAGAAAGVLVAGAALVALATNAISAATGGAGAGAAGATAPSDINPLFQAEGSGG